jgi:hypothetical protein
VIQFSAVHFSTSYMNLRWPYTFKCQIYRKKLFLHLSKYGRFHAVAMLSTFCKVLLLLQLLLTVLLLLLCCDINIILILLQAPPSSSLSLLFLTLSYFMWVVDFLQQNQELYICWHTYHILLWPCVYCIVNSIVCWQCWLQVRVLACWCVAD